MAGKHFKHAGKRTAPNGYGKYIPYRIVRTIKYHKIIEWIVRKRMGLMELEGIECVCEVWMGN